MINKTMVCKVIDFMELCVEKEIVISTAESCTGGLLSAYITSLPGSSAIFDRGFVTYSNNAKNQILDISMELINKYGAVSSEICIEMVKRALQNEANLSISITGIAGPTSDDTVKKIGLAYIATNYKGHIICKEFNFGNIGRENVRNRSVLEAIKLAQENILRLTV